MSGLIYSKICHICVKLDAMDKRLTKLEGSHVSSIVPDCQIKKPIVESKEDYEMFKMSLKDDLDYRRKVVCVTCKLLVFETT